MAAKKTIRLFNYEGLQYSRKYHGATVVDRSVTWVIFKLRRKTIRHGPTFRGLAACSDDNKFIQAYRESTSQCADAFTDTVLPEGPWEFCLPDYWDDLYGPHLADVVVNKERLTKEDIERAVSWYLVHFYKLKPNFRFKWVNVRKRTLTVVTPV